MTEARLTLSTYFGERRRTGGVLLADALPALYERHGVHTSIVLRGAEGFGLRHHLRTDRLLTLSEDLPVVSIAVDREGAIRPLLDELLVIKDHGLVTLERARMTGGTLAEVQLDPEPGAETKLTVYVGRKDRVDGRPAFVAICELLFERGLDGATVLLGVDGTVRGDRQRARFFGRNADVPLMITAVGATAKISALLPELERIADDPLVTLERVHVCKRDGRLPAPQQQLAATDASDASGASGFPVWQKLTVYSSEQSRHEGTPMHVAIVRALRQSGARGVTCMRGIWGFHGAHEPHGDRLLQIRRHVPVVTVALDTPEQTAESFRMIDAITRDSGLVTSELVPSAYALTLS